MADALRALTKLLLGGSWLVMALFVWLWSYAIVKSIGRPRTPSDAGEFLTPNNADVYPIFLVVCLFLLFLITLAFRQVQWPSPKEK